MSSKLNYPALNGLLLCVLLFANNALMANDGDFNGDSVWDVDDLDALVMEIADGTNDSAFDLTDDGVVDVADRDQWLSVAALANGFGTPFLVGDSDLDGDVDIFDLLNWRQHRNESIAEWSAGDFNATGFVDVFDLLAWRQNRLKFNNQIINLFNAGTTLEAPTTVDTPDALYTYLSDRGRDRHAREGQFQAYDHYLSWYWEQRVANIEIVDRVGRNGGTDITFNYTTNGLLNPAEFRTFFRGINTVAEYSHNQIATLVSTTDSSIPGETDYNYSATISFNTQFSRAIQVGDRVEIELSQFLLAPRNGRTNYYGTALLYIVGEGIVPWGQGNDLGFDGGIVGNVNQSLDSYPLPVSAWLGGKTTVHYPYSNEPDNAFKQTAGNISPTNGLPFMLGRRLHHTDFGDGSHSESGNPVFSAHIGKLGTKFTGRSCVQCHVNNGRALPPDIGSLMNQTVVRVASDETGSPHPVLGSVLQPQSTSGAAEGTATISSYSTINGTYADGTTYTLRQPNYTFSSSATPSHYSARLAPALVGMGLLEAISENSVTALADPDDLDSDGISGRPQIVTDPETGQPRLGRFGYKAAQARLKHQLAAAFNADMGVRTSVLPILDGETTAGSPEVSDEDLDLMVRYTALLGVQARSNLDDADALHGETLFATANCTKCHAPQFTTSPFHPMTELRNQTIHPYTDLLLHDMGPGLADNLGEGVATGSEWRTSPLWNIGNTAGVNGNGEAYLHDGRAQTLEEAILWHGGEADASKEAFRSMSASDRAALIKFLKSLGSSMNSQNRRAAPGPELKEPFASPRPAKVESGRAVSKRK